MLLFRSTASKLADCIHPYRRTHEYVLINITASEVLPPSNNFFNSLIHQTSEHLTGQKKVFGFEKCFDGIRYLFISLQKSGQRYVFSMYRIMWHRMVWDMISRYIVTPQRFPLRTRPAPWARYVCICFISHLSVFFFLSLSVFLLDSLYLVLLSIIARYL